MEQQLNAAQEVRTHPMTQAFGLVGMTGLGIALVAAIWVFSKRQTRATEQHLVGLDESLAETFPASDAVAQY